MTETDIIKAVLLLKTNKYCFLTNSPCYITKLARLMKTYENVFLSVL